MTETYRNAPASLIRQWQGRRARLAFTPGEALPAVDIDLTALLSARVADPLPSLPEGASALARKRQEIAAEFAGQPELYALHGLLIAHLRKWRAPKGTAALFRRMWTEQGRALIDGLPTRWLISAAITFGDHGASEGERVLGRELSVLFSLMKLYEYERLFSGRMPGEVFLPRDRVKAPLPLGMEPLSLVSGGLDVNLLAPIWKRAAAEPVLGPLACALLDRLNADEGTLFRRLSAMKRRRRRRLAVTAAAPPQLDLAADLR